MRSPQIIPDAFVVEAPDLEVGDVIVGAPFKRWQHRQTVARIEASGDDFILTIESRENGRHRMSCSRWAQYEVIRPI